MLALAALHGCGSADERPNIVIVVLDTLRRDATGPGASHRSDLTPELDRLAAEGTTFPNAWAPSPWTVPSHASLFTGLLPLTHGCITKNPRLGEVGPTFADLLADSGYETAAFYSNPWLADRTTGLLRGFQTRTESPIGGLTRLVSEDGDQGGRRTLRNVATWFESRDRTQPFCLFVNFLEAHLPYDPPDAYRAKHLPGRPGDDRVTIEWAHQFNAGLHPSETVDWEWIRAMYGGDVHSVDALLGQLIQTLDLQGSNSGTVLIVTSDHGENLGDHGLMEHQFSVHETVLGITLVFRAPASIMEPGVRPDPVLLTDLYPTVLEIAGITGSPTSAQGWSLLQPHSDRVADRPLFADYSEPSRVLLGSLQEMNPAADLSRLRPAWRTVRVGSLRLTAGSDGSILLHDMAADPEQRNNLAEEHPENVALLGRILMQSQVATRDKVGDEFELDAQTREQLRSLGYIR